MFSISLLETIKSLLHTDGGLPYLYRFSMLDFSKEVQSVIEVIDPSISYYLRMEPDILYLERWITNVNLEKVELIFIPYSEKCAFLNSFNPYFLFYINI